MKPYFPLLFLLPILSACSNASGTGAGKTADSIQPTASVKPATQPVSSAQAGDPSDSLPDQEVPELSTPPFGLDKVQAAIAQLQTVEDSNAFSESNTTAMSDTAYNTLPFNEQFTYNMIHTEDYSQMCDALPEHRDEKKRIYGQVVDFQGEDTWSGRQLSFFKDNRDSVDQLIKRVIKQQGKVGMNFLYVIAMNNATDLIPCLIDAYRKDNSNHYILTVLMLLMKKNSYPEFMQSISYKKLYSSDDDHTYSAYLTYNKANEDLIIRRATNFFNTRYPPAK